MRGWTRVVGGMVLALGACALSLGALAAQNYWRERQKPVYDPGRDQLSAIERPGAGARVLLLHGLGASSAIWQRTLRELPDDLDVLAPDLLGFGESPKPNASYDIPTHLRAIEELLARKRFDSGRKLLVVGHSMGAILAAAFAERHADRIDGLVLVSLPYYPTRGEAVAELREVSWMHRGMLSRNWAYKLLCYALHGRTIPGVGVLTGLPREVALDGLEHNWISIRRSLEQVILDADVAAFARQLPTNVRWLHGELDEVVPIANVRKLLSDLGRASALTELEGVGHDVPLYRPREIATAIVRGVSVRERLDDRTSGIDGTQ